MILSALGGILNVFATAFLAYPEAQQKTKGKTWSKCSLRTALVLNLVFQLANSGVNVVASWYGPVSTVIPTTVGSQLIFNMIMFSAILRLEPIGKDARVGTYITLVAVILLPVVGPGVQQHQDIFALLQQTFSIVWGSILAFAMVVSAIGLLCSTKMNIPEHYSFLFNLITQSTCGVLGATLSKMFVLVKGPALYITVLLWAVTGGVAMFAIVLQSKYKQNEFTPLNTASNIMLNGVTGIIIWQDWRVVPSWVGYGCVLALLLLGNYLISALDAFASSINLQKNYVRNLSIIMRTDDSNDSAKNGDKFEDDDREGEARIDLAKNGDKFDDDDDDDDQVEAQIDLAKNGDKFDDDDDQVEARIEFI